MKASKLFILFIILFFAYNAKGQKNKIYEDIQNAKSKGEKFELQERIFTQNEVSDEVLTNFHDPSEVSIFKYDFSILKSQSKSITISIPLKGENLFLELLEVDESFYNYKIITSFGKDLKVNANRKNKFYSGIIKGDKNSLVAISFFEEQVAGIISTDEGNFNIGKIDGSENIIFYKASNLLDPPNFSCGTLDDNFIGNKKEIFEKDNGSLDNCVRLYFETEYDMFLTLGSVEAVENYVIALFHEVQVLYAQENINVQLSAIFVWCCPDPYTANETGCLLAQFQHQTDAIPGDLGQLLTFRNVGGGRAAGFNGLCNPNVDLSLAVSGLRAGRIIPVPTYSWNVQLVTHEFGHLFGSRHTHACVWNGNNTAIDGCSGFTEGGCPLPGIPANGGTIMSYCHLAPVGINFNNGFGPQPGNVIRNRVENAACLQPCTNDPPDVSLSHDCVIDILPCGGGGGPYCGGIPYNPATQGCCDGVIYNLATHGCCDDAIYNLFTQGCCDDKDVYNLFTQGCCDDEIYNLLTEDCCVDEVYTIAIEGCCIDEVYNLATEGCCVDEVYNLATEGCCDDEVYNLATEGCCEDEVYTLATEGCCDDEVYDLATEGCCEDEVYDLATEGCCDDEVYDLDTQGCCEDEVYELDTQGCCEDEVYDLDSQGCCEDEVYDLDSQGCCDDEVYDLDSQGCCDDEVYDLNSQGCCEDEVYDSSTQGCCDGVIYDSSTQGCCDGVIYDVSTEQCCDADAENPGVQSNDVECNPDEPSGMGTSRRSPNKNKIISEDHGMQFRDLSLKLSPNPTNGIFNLEMDIPKSGIINIQIFDIYGQMVFHEQSYALKGVFRKQIELSNNLAEGAYFIKVSNNAKFVSKRILLIK